MSSADPDETIPEGEQKRSNLLLRAGAVMVIGGVAANVFGFRHSRWAVGKDIHRAWERYGTYPKSGSAGSSAGSQRASSARQQAPPRRPDPAQRSRTQRTSPQDMFDEFLREAARAAAAGSAAGYSSGARVGGQSGSSRSGAGSGSSRGSGSGSSRGSGSGSSGGSGSGRRARPGAGDFQFGGFRVEFDDADVRETLRNMRGERGGGFAHDEMLRGIEELLQAAQRAQGAQDAQSGARGRPRGGRANADDEFEDVWEEFFKQQQEQQRRQGRRGAGQTGDPFAGAGFGGRDAALRTLGLARGASDADVRAAYRREAFKWHPDKYAGGDADGAARKFREVTEAYELLRG